MQTFLFDDDGGSLKAEQDRLIEAMRSPDGTHCRACGQKVFLYARTFYSTMARSLIRLAIACGWRPDAPYVDIRYETNKFRDHDKLKHWGLIEDAPNDDPDKRTSGYWRVTSKGCDFARGLITVPKKLHIYNNTIYETEGSVSIRDAVGKKFSYEALMQGDPG